jgi:hypothetical protein
MPTPRHPDNDHGLQLRKGPSKQMMLVAGVVVTLVVAVIAVHAAGVFGG